MNVISLYAIRKSSYEYPLEHYSITLRVDRAIVTVVLRLHDVVDGGARLAIAIVAEVVQHETTATTMLASLIAGRERAAITSLVDHIEGRALSFAWHLAHIVHTATMIEASSVEWCLALEN